MINFSQPTVSFYSSIKNWDMFIFFVALQVEEVFTLDLLGEILMGIIGL